jgi:hypothetical protein
MIQIKLNGIPITGRIEGLESFTATYSRDSETGRTQKTYTNELAFYDDGFDLIYPILVASPTGLSNVVNVEVWDDCCNTPVVRNFIIGGDAVDYCDNDCFVTCRLIRKDPDELIYECLQNHQISDNRNGYFYYDPNGQPKFPLVAYCNELRPNWLMLVILYYALSLAILSKVALPALILALFGIILFVYGICSILKGFENLFNSFLPGNPVNLTPGVCDQILADPFFIFKEFDKIVDKIIENLVGCGRKHPTPLYRQYVENACQICGINQFNSSILNDPNSEYYNALYFYAPADAGSRNPTAIIQENRPTMTMDSWLSQVAKDFNARWWISQGQLYFERLDYYLQQPPIYDAVANTETGDILEGVCFSYNEGRQFKAININCQMDALDDVGNEDKDRYNYYRDYGNNQAWQGTQEIMLSYAPARFRDDKVEPDVLTEFSQIPLSNWLLNGQLNGTNDYLLMSKGTCIAPKMLIWDGQSRTTAIIKKYNGVQNMPAMVNSNQFDLYSRFWQINNPTQNPFRYWNANFTVRMSCDLASQLDVNRTVRLKTPYGAIVNARIKEITADFGNRQITFQTEF